MVIEALNELKRALKCVNMLIILLSSNTLFNPFGHIGKSTCHQNGYCYIACYHELWWVTQDFDVPTSSAANVLSRPRAISCLAFTSPVCSCL